MRVDSALCGFDGSHLSQLMHGLCELIAGLCQFVLVLRQLIPGLCQLMVILCQLMLDLYQPRAYSRKPLIAGRKAFQLGLNVGQPLLGLPERHRRLEKLGEPQLRQQQLEMMDGGSGRDLR